MSTNNSSKDDDEKHVGFIIDSRTKRMVLMRAGQLGYDNMSHYFRALLEKDLQDADLPPLEDLSEEELGTFE